MGIRKTPSIKKGLLLMQEFAVRHIGFRDRVNKRHVIVPVYPAVVPFDK